MGLLAPLALALAGLGLPIFILYMLKLRRERRVISSTMLWQQAIQDREANTPWQKIRRNLLLLLQLLILFLLVLALARPYSEISRVFQGNIIILLDVSASMQATDGGSAVGTMRTRFDTALDRAGQIVDRLGPNDTLTLITVGNTPSVLASLTNDKSVLRQALATARVSNTQADWEAAFILAQSSAQQAERTTTIILSDGGLSDNLPPLPGQVRYVPTGIATKNVAIAALAVRDSPHGPQGFVRVVNTGNEPVKTLVQILVDGSLFDARTLDIAPSSESGFPLFELPLDTQQIEARLPEDVLTIDNAAWAVRPLDQQATVLLVTPGNTFLERAVSLMPNLSLITIHVTETLPASITATPSDLVIFDTLIPTKIPTSGNLLFIAPPDSTELFQVTGTMTDTTILDVKVEHPLLRYVEADLLRDIQISRAHIVHPPAWAEILASTHSEPLLLAGEVNGRRIAILSFDLHHSDLPLKIAFPILVANLTQWLAPLNAIDVPDQLSPGIPVLIRPQTDATEIAITSPSGQTWVQDVDGSTPLPFVHTSEPGIYVVEQRGGAKISRAIFAVNLFSELESNIAPRDTINVGQSTVAGQLEGSAGRREWWRWPALAALVVLLVEWVVQLGGRVPPMLREISARHSALPRD